MAKTQFTAHGQLPVAKPLTDNDVLVVDVVDSRQSEGYLTSNTSLSLASRSVQTIINNNQKAPFITILPGGGLQGNGTADDPLSADMDYVYRSWAASAYSNVVQIGEYGKTLPFQTTANGTTAFQVTADIPYHISGVSGTLRKGLIFNDFYYPITHFYLTIQNGRITAQFSPDILPETITRVYIGTRIGNEQVAGKFPPVFRINESRLSEAPQGSATPVSSGNPTEPNGTSWGITQDIYTAVGIVPIWSADAAWVDEATEQIMYVNGGGIDVQNPVRAGAEIRDFYITAVISDYPNAASSIFINGAEVGTIVGSSYNPINITAFFRSGPNVISSTNPVKIFISGPFYKVYE